MTWEMGLGARHPRALCISFFVCYAFGKGTFFMLLHNTNVVLISHNRQGV